MGSQIKNIEGMSIADINEEIGRGAKFVYFTYTVSILVMTFKRPTDIYFVKAGESPIKHSAGYLALSLVAGWWGIPWGPIYTIGSIATAFNGNDVTGAVLNDLRASSPN